MQQVSQEFNIDVRSLRDKAVFAHFVVARREFCIRSRKLKLKVKEIGRALNRDHTTISYHSSPEMRAKKKSKRKPKIPVNSEGVAL